MNVKSTLADYVNTFGQEMLRRYGERIHKIAIDATFTCPNRDGTKGRGGCTFCNNASFSPNGLKPKSISFQIDAGKNVIRKRTGALRYIAYFQTYTNTYGDIDKLRSTYDQALAQQNIVGLSVGTRLAKEWRRNEYIPLEFDDYIETVCDMIELTPTDVVYHRLTGTAPDKILLAPSWCGKKWKVLNGISNELRRRNTYQGIYHTPDNICVV